MPRDSRVLRLLGHVARRLAWAAWVVVGATAVSVLLTRLLPGDPARLLAGPRAPAAEVDRTRALYGLDRPLGVQLSRAAKRLVHLPQTDGEHRTCSRLGGLHVDLGFSVFHRRPVAELLAARAPRSFELAAAAIALQALFGLAVGVAGALRPRSWVDRLGGATTLALLAAPTFVVGLGLQLWFAHRSHVLPIDGDGGGADHLAHLVLPALTLGLYGAGMVARLVREQAHDALESNVFRAARARGASRWRAAATALRAGLVPVITLLGLELGTLAGGAMVTEAVFRWPGLGKLTVDALHNRDAPLVLATVALGGALVAASTLLVDAVAWLLDPRRRRP
jgi:peptide/nickel transport system permease protein